jgi:hypothetical protein
MIPFWLALTQSGLAGTIRIHSAGPVTYHLDGEVVGRVVTDVTLTDVEAGAHVIAVYDAYGAALASTDVILREEEPLWFQYANHRLLQVDAWVQRPAGEMKLVTDNEFRWIEHRINRKRKDDKRMKRLTEVANLYWFEMRHVDSLLFAFSSIEMRVQVSELLAPRTMDPENTRAIEDHFPPGSFRERAMAAFALYQ